MTNQIKNFIIEGEKARKEFYESFKDFKELTTIDSICIADWWLEKLNQSQISLIKMIVEEYGSIPSYSCNTYSVEGDRILPLMVQKADIDTISSKLKELYTQNSRQIV
jgi:hypothetical protein